MYNPDKNPIYVQKNKIFPTVGQQCLRALRVIWGYDDHDDVIKWKQFPRSWPFVRGIHLSPVNSPHKGQWCGALVFSLICAWTSNWANNGDAGDLRRYCTHYDVIVMMNTNWGCAIWDSHPQCTLNENLVKSSLPITYLSVTQSFRNYAQSVTVSLQNGWQIEKGVMNERDFTRFEFKMAFWRISSLRWRHNERDSVSNHQPHHCLLNRLFRRRSKKTSKFRVTGLCGGNSPGTGEFPAQMASYAENVSIWWSYHAILHTHPDVCRRHCSAVTCNIRPTGEWLCDFAHVVYWPRRNQRPVDTIARDIHLKIHISHIPPMSLPGIENNSKNWPQGEEDGARGASSCPVKAECAIQTYIYVLDTGREIHHSRGVFLHGITCLWQIKKTW